MFEGCRGNFHQKAMQESLDETAGISDSLLNCWRLLNDSLKFQLRFEPYVKFAGFKFQPCHLRTSSSFRLLLGVVTIYITKEPSPTTNLCLLFSSFFCPFVVRCVFYTK